MSEERVKSSKSVVRSLRQQVAALQGANEDLREQVESLTERLLNLSQQFAEFDYGCDRVSAALAAVNTAGPDVQSWVAQQSHPFGALVAWHRTAMN